MTSAMAVRNVVLAHQAYRASSKVVLAEEFADWLKREIKPRRESRRRPPSPWRGFAQKVIQRWESRRWPGPISSGQ